MKKLALIVLLSGCSLLPKQHDPVMFDNLVSVKISVENLSCDRKDNWDRVIGKVHHMAVYSELRNDPQSKSVYELEDALGKAKTTTSKIVCDDILVINKERINVISKVWSGR
jgi:hypothetical protein